MNSSISALCTSTFMELETEGSQYDRKWRSAVLYGKVMYLVTCEGIKEMKNQLKNKELKPRNLLTTDVIEAIALAQASTCEKRWLSIMYKLGDTTDPWQVEEVLKIHSIRSNTVAAVVTPTTTLLNEPDKPLSRWEESSGLPLTGDATEPRLIHLAENYEAKIRAATYKHIQQSKRLMSFSPMGNPRFK